MNVSADPTSSGSSADAVELRAELASTARRILSAHCSPADVRRGIGGPAVRDAPLWSAAASGGWFGLEVPVEHGGAGAGFGEVVSVLHELGRALAPGAIATSMVLGTGAVLGAGSAEQRNELLPGIADGSVLITAALSNAAGSYEPAGLGVAADHVTDGHRLTGSISHVPDGVEADWYVVVGVEGDVRTLFLVDRRAAGVSVTPLESTDLTRRFARVDLDNVEVGSRRLLGKHGGADAITDWLVDRAAIALAADAAGGAARVVEIATQYAKDRFQFGRPIGSFQAVKHLCVNMHVAAEAARTASERGGDAASGPGEWSQWAPISKSFCADAYAQIATDGVQVHGGIGFTWEHDMHLYVRRALLDQVLFGTSAWHRERLVHRLLLEPAP